MFRALAKQLSGDSDKNGQLRHRLCEFISLNGELLKEWVTAGITLDEYLTSVRKIGTWETQLELKAAATLFNTDMYIATYFLLTSGHYIWTKISPVKPVSSCLF